MPLLNELLISTTETLYMVIIASLISVMIGLPIGIFLFTSKQPHFLLRPTLHRIVGAIVNCVRSVPFIILMVAILPLTRLIVGTSIGTTAAIVPLSLAAIPFFARISQSAFEQLDTGLIEASVALGATPLRIITRILLPECAAELIRGLTLMLISLVGYSAMAGTIGGGGLGDLAIRYGYQRFDTTVMLTTTVILIVLVQLIQWGGETIARRLSH